MRKFIIRTVLVASFFLPTITSAEQLTDSEMIAAGKELLTSCHNRLEEIKVFTIEDVFPGDWDRVVANISYTV